MKRSLLAIIIIFILINISFATDYQSTEDSTTNTLYDLIGLNEHIGFNGFTFSTLFFNQTFVSFDRTSSKHSLLNWAISGDILTGLPFIHLMPSVLYWQYEEASKYAFIEKEAHRDVSISFNTILLSKRFSNRKSRVFIGGGPSLHLNILTQYNEYNQTKSTPSIRNGIGGLFGAELPLTGNITFVSKVLYKQTYNWNKHNRSYFCVSVGVAI